MSERPSIELVRMYCDGELTPEQAVQLQRRLAEHPELREEFERHVGFERQLRERLCALLKQECPKAPADVCDRIRAAISKAELAQSSPAQSSKAGRVEPSPARASRQSILASLFTGPRRVNAFAVAACIALISGIVLYSIFAPTIDDLRAPGPKDLVSTAALFASQEHDRFTANGETARQLVHVNSVPAAEAELSTAIGVPVDVFDLTDLNYKFAGSCLCDMGLPEPSGHLFYESMTLGEHVPKVSIYITPKRGACSSMCQGNDASKWLEAQGLSSQCRHRVLYSTDHKLVYFVVCCNEADLDSVTKVIRATASAVPSPGR